MARSFDPVAYTIQVGQELVAAFQMAGFATTPGLVGSAREVPVREKLMKLLPRSLAGKPLAGFCATQSRRIPV